MRAFVIFTEKFSRWFCLNVFVSNFTFHSRHVFFCVLRQFLVGILFIELQRELDNANYMTCWLCFYIIAFTSDVQLFISGLCLEATMSTHCFLFSWRTIGSNMIPTHLHNFSCLQIVSVRVQKILLCPPISRFALSFPVGCCFSCPQFFYQCLSFHCGLIVSLYFRFILVQ